MFAEFFSSPEMLEFVHSWTGLRKEQLAFSVPLIFCNSVKNDDYQWTPGGGGWQCASPPRLAPPGRFTHSPAFARSRDGRWWGGDDTQMMFNHQAEEPPKDYSIEAERERWAEWTQTPGKRIVEREPTEERPGLLSTAAIFFALVDDACHVIAHTSPGRRLYTS